MRPDSARHEALSNATPGEDEQEVRQFECPECGDEHEINQAAVAVAEEYTCPECGHHKEFNSHIGLVFLIVVAVVIYAGIVSAVKSARARIPI